MDFTIHRPRATCALTGQPFTAGEPFYSALVREQGRLERRDFSPAAWTGPSEETVAWWRSNYPASAAGTAALAPSEVLLDVVEELEDHEADAALRYLLSLELVRRRVLRFADVPAGSAPPARADGRREHELLLICRKRERDYRVRVITPDEANAPGVEARLTALLWSGGAA